MGWCSGTEIFDVIAKALLEKEKPNPKQILEIVIDALEDSDWDCQKDSAYWDHPLVREIFKKRNPNWFKE
jgi:hypothetical protein